MGSLALPCGSLFPLMPTNLVSVRHFFFTAIITSYNPSNMSKNYCLEKTLQIYKGYFVENKYFTKKMMYLT